MSAPRHPPSTAVGDIIDQFAIIPDTSTFLTRQAFLRDSHHFRGLLSQILSIHLTTAFCSPRPIFRTAASVRRIRARAIVRTFRTLVRFFRTRLASVRFSEIAKFQLVRETRLVWVNSQGDRPGAVESDWAPYEFPTDDVSGLFGHRACLLIESPTTETAHCRRDI